MYTRPSAFAGLRWSRWLDRPTTITCHEMAPSSGCQSGFSISFRNVTVLPAGGPDPSGPVPAGIRATSSAYCRMPTSRTPRLSALCSPALKLARASMKR